MDYICSSIDLANNLTRSLVQTCNPLVEYVKKKLLIIQMMYMVHQVRLMVDYIWYKNVF